MAEPVDASRALTPPLIDIADSKIRSLSREFRERKYWMKRRLDRYPLIGFVSEWDVARGLTTLAAVCGVVALSSVSGLFLARSHITDITPPAPGVVLPYTESDHSEIAEAPKPAKQLLSHLLFNGFSSSKLKTVRDDIEKEAKIFIPTPVREQARILGSNHWEYLTDSVVTKPELKIPVSEQEAWSKLLRAIIFVESGGNPKAISSTGAAGLAQVEKGSADKAADRLGMREYDPFDPETNLTLAARILQRNLYLFNGDLELALEAYNLGDNAIAGALKTYYIIIKNFPMSKVQNDFVLMGKHGDEDPASRVYLQEHPATFEDLFVNPETSPKITGYLNSVWGISKKELNFNTRVYLAAKSLFPNEINPIFNQRQTKA